MNIIEVTNNLYLIDLPQRLEGFRKFISCWVYKDGDRAFLVDVGPRATASKLIEALKFLGISKVDYVLLTHIHLDHAGCLDCIISYFAEAKVVVHDIAYKHLLNPEKLWKASLEALGQIAEAYGELKAIEEDRIWKGEVEFGGEEIRILKTPGHAPHHQSYVFKDLLFVGESFGVYMPLKGDYYLRPATPHKFDYEAAFDSIEKLIKLGELKVCFGHFGFNKNSLEVGEKALRQLRLWVSTVYDIVCKKDIKDEEEIVREAKKELLEKDARFSRYHLLDPDIKKREDFFIKNSLIGIARYVSECI